MIGPSKDVKPFEYVNDAKIPFYPPGEKWGTTTEPIKNALPKSGCFKIKAHTTPKTIMSGTKPRRKLLTSNDFLAKKSAA